VTLEGGYISSVYDKMFSWGRNGDQTKRCAYKLIE